MTSDLLTSDIMYKEKLTIKKVFLIVLTLMPMFYRPYEGAKLDLTCESKVITLRKTAIGISCKQLLYAEYGMCTPEIFLP